ncbi:MAG: chromosomal replication initiator protein DnaA [Erysipelotrichaceae bacterium]|nr:chromosomal replication initiator protein DnaA [Erysipelotrichaceae bacterium]
MPISLSQKEKIWESVLSLLKETIEDRHVFDSFFATTKLYKIDGNKFIILTTSKLSYTFLSSRYLSSIENAVKNVTETNYSISFINQDDIQSSIQTMGEEPKHNFFQSCSLNSKYTFDNFVVGNSNQEAVQASLFITTSPGESFNPLFIYSKSGLGKTHLLHAIGNHIKEKRPFYRVLYITTDAFIDEFVKYVRGNQQDESLKDFLKTVDVLLVDDIQFLSEKNKTAEMFFNVFNFLISNGKQVVLTSDKSPNELKGLDDRLVSRFNMGLSVNIKNPDVDTCIEILKRKIEANSLNINDFDYDGLVYLAENFSRNVRELEGALNRLLFYKINSKHTSKIDVDTIMESVSGIKAIKDKSKTLTEERIIEAVGDYYRLTEEQIKSKVRTSQIALARQICMYLCRNLLNTPFVQIGKIFGGRDHSTVMTAVEKVENLLKTDTQLSTAISQIKKSLQ